MYIKQSSSITFGLRALQLGEIYIINNKMEYFKNILTFLLDYILSTPKSAAKMFPQFW